MNKKILLINTGGTIGMVGEPLQPTRNWNELTKEHPILQRYPVGYYQFDSLVDSSDMHPKLWIEMAELIQKEYDNYDGFVILHGTDTMAYTASALSFLLQNLGKTIILTGSQVPLAKPRSDALQNLITALEIASKNTIPEVCILFRDCLLRGNRSKKTDASNYFGFSSPNYPALAEIGTEIKIAWDKIRPKDIEPFHVDARLNSDILLIELFPGISFQIYQDAIERGAVKGVILKSYGNGNAPTRKDFFDFLAFLQEKQIPIVDVTQCIRGSVELGKYASSQALANYGVISAKDMTLEACLAKLMYFLGCELSYAEILEQFPQDFVGEISQD